MSVIRAIGDEKYSVVEVAEEIPDTVATSVYGVLRELWRRKTFFMPDGSKVGLRPVSGHEIGNRALWMLLANTFYNPRRTVRVARMDRGRYTIAELKSSIVHWLDRDDDILTQFLEPAEIKTLLSHVRTFDEMVLAVRAICGEHEKDKALADYLSSLGI